MKQSKFSDSQIATILQESQNGLPTPELCRKYGISNATFYNWRSKYSGMDASLMSRLKSLEEENRRLKKMYAEAQLHTDILKEALGKK
jgi:putative transposase